MINQHTKEPQAGMRSLTLTLSAEFLALCTLAFTASVLSTIHFCHSVCCEMQMPGGWSMSMMWMPMAGQSWPASSISFLLMWLSMMIAMMMPSALPMFLKTQRRWPALCSVASGYFAIWLAAGAGLYFLGTTFMAAATHSDSLSRAVPLFSAIAPIAAGAVQLTRWKMLHLLRCRSLFGCAISRPPNGKSFQLGCKQGVACFICCAAPMTIQIALGIMNPVAMITVATAIAAEKLFPRPALVARVIGIAAIIAGVISFCVAVVRN